MDPRWHSDAVAQRGFRLAARVCPPVVATLGVTYALVNVFPRSTGHFVAISLLFVAGLCAATIVRRVAPPIHRVEGADPAARLYDEESRLGNRLYLLDVLGREVARNARSTTRCTLAVFETRLVGSDERKLVESRAETAAFVGRHMKTEARGSDYVARVSHSRWAALLTDTDRDGARAFATRLMRRLSEAPVMRGSDGTGLFVRAIATAVPWRPDHRSAEVFLEEALGRLDATGPRAAALGQRETPPAGAGHAA